VVLAAQNQIQISSESRCKSLYSVHDENLKTIGKYKPNHPGVAAREVRGYGYDSILGMGMTPPTGYAKLSMQNALESLNSAFKCADEKRKRALESSNRPQLGEAWGLHQRAMDQFAQFPDEIKQGIYGCISARFAHENFDHGASLWWNHDLGYISDKYRGCAIEDFLKSEAFQRFKMGNSFETKDELGSLQRWINDSSRIVIDYILQNEDAGTKLRQIPQAHVQLYCILGLIKGARDGYSRNAMVTFAENGSIDRIHEFDDERSMPTHNAWHEFRLWQFGLPQADMPFDRTTLLLFSKQELLKEIQAYNRSDKQGLLSSQSYAAQEQRVARMIELFQNELQKTVPTLTPRDLFFEVTGGRENFEHWHRREGLNPWVVFEYSTGEVGRGTYFCGDEGYAALDRTFSTLYDNGEEKARRVLQSTCSMYPKTQLVVKYNAGVGNDLFIKGSLPGLNNWGLSVPLKCIDADTWILESNEEIVEGEFKIYLNGSTEDIHGWNRSVQPDCKSRVIFPWFN
jgi:hypothetical protein